MIQIIQLIDNLNKSKWLAHHYPDTAHHVAACQDKITPPHNHLPVAYQVASHSSPKLRRQKLLVIYSGSYGV